MSREHLAYDVLSGIEGADGERCVLVRVVGKHDSVHIVLYEIIKPGIERRLREVGSFFSQLTDTLLPVLKSRFVSVAERDKLGVRKMEAEVYHGASAVRAENAYLYLTVVYY